MKAIIQNVNYASITINNKITASIKNGMVISLGIKETDDQHIIKKIINKIINAKIFSDEKTNLLKKSIKDISGSILVVPQFAIYGQINNSGRLDFGKAAQYKKAKDLYNIFLNEIMHYNLKVETGIFGAKMQLIVCNNGPVTIIIEQN